MSKTKEQRELEHFLGADRELEEKFKRGDIQRVNYLIRQKHIKAQLFERAPLAHHALESAGQLLNHWTMYTMVERAAREELMNWDLEALQVWQTDYTTRNLEPLAFKILAALELIEKMPIPPPRPEAIESMRQMRNHQMVPTPAPPRKPEAKLVFHPDPTGQTAGTLVGAGGGGGQAGSGATTAVGHGGNGSAGYDPRIHHERRRPADLIAANRAANGEAWEARQRELRAKR